MHRGYRALFVSAAMSIAPTIASAQNDPKVAAAAAKSAAEKAKTEAQAVAAASGDLRLRGPNGSFDVIQGSTNEIVLVYTVLGVNPTLKFRYAPTARPSVTGGFFEAASSSTGPLQGLSADQRADMMAALNSAAVKGPMLAASAPRTAGTPSFVRKELHFAPPPPSVTARDNFANVEITASDAAGTTKTLTLRVDLVKRGGTFVSNFRADNGYSLENAYLALALDELGDKTESYRKIKLSAFGFDTTMLQDLGGPASDGFAVSNDDAVYVVVRGTNPTDLASWFTDIQLTQDGASRYARSPAAKVHHGFRVQFEQDFEPLILQRLNGARDAGKPIILIGHSLGAAVVTLAAARLDMLGKTVRAVYAFASPSVGNAEFRNDYNSRLGQRHYRMINQEDIVPRLAAPPLYYAVGRLWYIDHNPGHAIRQLEFDDLDVSMTAHCTLHCNPTAFATRHRLEEYWFYVAAALPASVDKTKLPPAPAKPSLAP
jgi:pimeloyl-ACP methyl ester carboxylesterase